MATVLKLVTNPTPMLRQRSIELSKDQILVPETQQLINNMIDTMWHANGIGIAAVQVGILQRIMVITKGREPIVLINPVLSSISWRKDVMEEGCLSVPGFYGPVKRPKKVKLKALTRQGAEVTLRAEGLIARIIQHEVDHLNGKLYIDRADKVHSVESVN